MKTIQKILWGFISTAICLLYKTDVNAVAPTYYRTYNNGQIKFQVNTNNATCTPTTTYNCGTALVSEDMAIQSAIQNGVMLSGKCGLHQYVTGCDCDDGTFNCCTSSNIHCAACPDGGSTVRSAAIYVKEAQDLGSRCCHWDGNPGTSYNMFFQLAQSQIIIVNPGITNCFKPKATTYKDGAGQYEFTNSCYYNG